MSCCNLSDVRQCAALPLRELLGGESWVGERVLGSRGALLDGWGERWGLPWASSTLNNPNSLRSIKGPFLIPELCPTHSASPRPTVPPIATCPAFPPLGSLYWYSRSFCFDSSLPSKHPILLFLPLAPGMPSTPSAGPGLFSSLPIQASLLFLSSAHQRQQSPWLSQLKKKQQQQKPAGVLLLWWLFLFSLALIRSVFAEESIPDAPNNHRCARGGREAVRYCSPAMRGGTGELRDQGTRLGDANPSLRAQRHLIGSWAAGLKPRRARSSEPHRQTQSLSQVASRLPGIAGCPQLGVSEKAEKEREQEKQNKGGRRLTQPYSPTGE